MDPITTAIMAVAPALAAGVVSDAVKDAYVGLKEIIRRKWGEGSSVEQAVEAVESNPASTGRATVLQEEVANSGAQSDPEIMSALKALVEALQKADIGGKDIADIKVSISGGSVQGVVGSHSVRVDSMNFGGPTSSDSGQT